MNSISKQRLGLLIVAAACWQTEKKAQEFSAFVVSQFGCRQLLTNLLSNACREIDYRSVQHIELSAFLAVVVYVQ